MREVSKDEFFATVGQMNVHPRIVGDYPYTSRFCSPDGIEYGRIVNALPEGRMWPVLSRYFVS